MRLVKHLCVQFQGVKCAQAAAGPSRYPPEATSALGSGQFRGEDLAFQIGRADGRESGVDHLPPYQHRFCEFTIDWRRTGRDFTLAL